MRARVPCDSPRMNSLYIFSTEREKDEFYIKWDVKSARFQHGEETRA